MLLKLNPHSHSSSHKLWIGSCDCKVRLHSCRYLVYTTETVPRSASSQEKNDLDPSISLIHRSCNLPKNAKQHKLPPLTSPSHPIRTKNYPTAESSPEVPFLCKIQPARVHPQVKIQHLFQNRNEHTGSHKPPPSRLQRFLDPSAFNSSPSISPLPGSREGKSALTTPPPI